MPWHFAELHHRGRVQNPRHGLRVLGVEFRGRAARVHEYLIRCQGSHFVGVVDGYLNGFGPREFRLSHDQVESIGGFDPVLAAAPE